MRCDGNHNVVGRVQQEGLLLITKKYTERTRFLCEQDYLQRFSTLGFSVPHIRARDERQMLLQLEGIHGKVKDTLSYQELTWCVDVCFC